MKSDRHITLKCGTEIYLDDLEAAGISYVPCGQIDGTDQPLFPFAHLWGRTSQVTLKHYGKKANAWTLNRMTGVQIITGGPTNRGRDFLVDVDIEKHLIDTYPEITADILARYRANCKGTPCIVQTKSDGLRLSGFTPYNGRKYSFEDAGGMLLEIFSYKGLSRLDHRYAMLEGSVLDIPDIPIELVREIHGLLSAIAPEKKQGNGERQTVERSQIGELEIEWDAEGHSQYFSTDYCQATSHASNRESVRFTKYKDGSVDGKCFNCGETWWEIRPKPRFSPPSYRYWTPEERVVVKEILGVSPDAGWNENTPAFATRYANLHPLTGEFALNGQPSEVEKRRVWSTEFGNCPTCGGITANWVDRYLLTAGRYCNDCHTDTPIGSYLEWELQRKLPNSIVSEHQGYLGDDPEFQDFRLWEPEMLTHLGAGMSTGKSTEIYKAIVSLATQGLGVGLIASPRISLSRFLAHQLRKRHGKQAWGLWHEGSGAGDQFIGTYGAIVCLPSLGRAVARAEADGLDTASLYLAIDEVDFSYGLLSLAVQQAAAVKKCLLDIFLATGIVLSGQTESTLALEAFAAELGGQHVQGFYNTAPPADGVVEMRKYPAVEGKNALVLAGAMESVAGSLEDGYNVYVFCSSRRDSDIIATRFSEYHPVCYNAYTKGDPRCDAVLRNQGLSGQSRLFIGTSAAGVGISILDPKAKTIIVAGLNHGSRGTSMLVQKAVRDRGRRGIELHYTDYNFALPVRPREVEAVSLYHEEVKQLESQYAHLPEHSVKKVARSLALGTLADTQFDTFVKHHLGAVGNMQVVQTSALPAAEGAVEWVAEYRRDSIRTEREAVVEGAMLALKHQNVYTRREIRVASNRGNLRKIEQLTHEYANGLARAVGWNEETLPMPENTITAAVLLAEQNVKPERLEKLRRGYLSVHYPDWVTAVFEHELEEARADTLEAGDGRELTAITDDRFLGEVLKALLDRLTGEVFTGDASLADAIREALDAVSHGQTLFGRIKQGGLGAHAYRRARFLNVAGDAYTVNWARTFIKEFYPAMLSKRGERYALVDQKHAGLIVESIRCWLVAHEADIPEIEAGGFVSTDPQVMVKDRVREGRRAGGSVKALAAEFGVSMDTVSRWCKDIVVEREKATVRESRAARRAEKVVQREKAVALEQEGKTRTEIARELGVNKSTITRWLES